MSTVVKYKMNLDCYYKINSTLKRITKIQKNEVSYLDYDSNIEEISRYINIKMNQWKNVENKFFVSRHFEWEYNGKKYRTTDKPIEWVKSKTYGLEAKVFHNGKIWLAHNSANYCPKIYLSKEVYETPTRKVIFEKNTKIPPKLYSKSTTKWTDIKYCRHFEEVK